MKYIVYWLNGIYRHGWLFMIAHIYPVSFIQDIGMKNNGYDILSLSSHKGYYTGLIRNNSIYKGKAYG